MKKFILIFAALITIENTAFSQAANSGVVKNLSADRFKAIIAYDKKGVILDLRTKDEIKNGFIKGSVQLDFLAKDAEQQIDKLDKNITYYVYCAGGGRSAEATAYMEKHNFKSVYNFELGFAEWEKKGFPIEKQ